MRTYEEKIGVRLPGQGFETVSMRVSADATDEEILRRISTQIGTQFNVGGVKYEVVSSLPFRLKRLPREQELEERKVQDSVPPSEKRISHQDGPLIGERWKPKDPRRISAFTVMAIEDGYAVTDDGRRIQVTRFNRYERIPEPASKVS